MMHMAFNLLRASLVTAFFVFFLVDTLRHRPAKPRNDFPELRLVSKVLSEDPLSDNNKITKQ